jgi:murein L,D-transpeptidase YafK
MTLSFLIGTAASLLLAPSDSARPKTVSPAVPPAKETGMRTAVAVVADSVVVQKSARTLALYHQGVPVRVYFIALGQNPVGDKVQKGDNRTPEGVFRIINRNPDSKYHLALRISYPDEAHAARARALGVEAGGDIMIHGLPDESAGAGVFHRVQNWTNGCIAVTNDEIEEIWRAIPDGTPIQIKP